MIVSKSCFLSVLSYSMRMFLNESMSAKSFGVKAESTADGPGFGIIGCRFCEYCWNDAAAGLGFALGEFSAMLR